MPYLCCYCPLNLSISFYPHHSSTKLSASHVRSPSLFIIWTAASLLCGSAGHAAVLLQCCCNVPAPLCLLASAVFWPQCLFSHAEVLYSLSLCLWEVLSSCWELNRCLLGLHLTSYLAASSPSLVGSWFSLRTQLYLPLLTERVKELHFQEFSLVRSSCPLNLESRHAWSSPSQDTVQSQVKSWFKVSEVSGTAPVKCLWCRITGQPSINASLAKMLFPSLPAYKCGDVF